MNIAAIIEHEIYRVTELQKTYVAGICSGCVKPCCTRVNYLFCEKDILFFKLSGRRHRWRRQAAAEKGCRFLGSAGCVLDPAARPFICHRYICPDLEKEIKKQDPGIFISLSKKFKALDELRSRMWAEFLEQGMR